MNDERTDRIDRVLLRLIGIVLTLLGIAVLLHSTGALGSRRAASPVLSSPTVAWYRDNGSWLWPALIVILLVVVGASVWWVSTQVRLQGSSRIELERDPGGTLDVSGHHLAECVERDALNQRGIERARARVSTTPQTVHVWLTIWVGPPYDVGRSVARVANVVLPNLRTTLDGADARPIRTHITVETAEAVISKLD